MHITYSVTLEYSAKREIRSIDRGVERGNLKLDEEFRSKALHTFNPTSKRCDVTHLILCEWDTSFDVSDNLIQSTLLFISPHISAPHTAFQSNKSLRLLHSWLTSRGNFGNFAKKQTYPPPRPLRSQRRPRTRFLEARALLRFFDRAKALLLSCHDTYTSTFCTLLPSRHHHLYLNGDVTVDEAFSDDTDRIKHHLN